MPGRSCLSDHRRVWGSEGNGPGLAMSLSAWAVSFSLSLPKLFACLCGPLMLPPTLPPTPSIPGRGRKKTGILSKLKGQGRGRGLYPTYIGFEVTGCRMTWGARVGVSGTGTTSESQRLESQKPDEGSTSSPKSLIPGRCRWLEASHQIRSPWLPNPLSPFPGHLNLPAEMHE